MADERQRKQNGSLEASIEDLKSFLKDRHDLTDEAIEHETPDSVLSSFGGKRALEAVETARKGLAAEPDNPRLKEWLAFNLYAADALDEAIRLYRELLRLDDTNVERHYYLGNCYFKKGFFPNAISEWKRVVELSPDGRRGVKAQIRIDKVRRTMISVASGPPIAQ